MTGYPWYDIDTPAHDAFLAAYQQRWDDYPRIGSVVGYNTMLAIKAMLERAGSTETEAMVDALEGLSFDAPTGPITFRAIDHQATMGAYVGWTTLRDGQGVMAATGSTSTERTTCRPMTRFGNCAVVAKPA